MNPKELKIGDRIRILSVPHGTDAEYYWISKDTVRVFKKIIARKRSVRISEIDEDGTPWYTCKFKRKNGTWEWHYMAVLEGDGDNWVKVKKKT